jgi:hypothetical protein
MVAPPASFSEALVQAIQQWNEAHPTLVINCSGRSVSAEHLRTCLPNQIIGRVIRIRGKKPDQKLLERLEVDLYIRPGDRVALVPPNNPVRAIQCAAILFGCLDQWPQIVTPGGYMPYDGVDPQTLARIVRETRESEEAQESRFESRQWARRRQTRGVPQDMEPIDRERFQVGNDDGGESQ